MECRHIHRRRTHNAHSSPLKENAKASHKCHHEFPYFIAHSTNTHTKAKTKANWNSIMDGNSNNNKNETKENRVLDALIWLDSLIIFFPDKQNRKKKLLLSKGQCNVYGDNCVFIRNSETQSERMRDRERLCICFDLSNDVVCPGVILVENVYPNTYFIYM